MIDPFADVPNVFSSDIGRASARRAALAARVRGLELTVVPGVSDPLAARLVEGAGFASCYASGAGIANQQHGIADLGMIGLTEVADVVRRVCDAVSLPVVVDADTGYGSPLSVMRTVHLFEAAGAAAVQLEDQQMPKSCGHFDSHELVETGEMVAKLRAAVAARSDADTLIVGRTDALGVLGIDEALRRGHRYLEAGADVLFVEAPTSEQQLERIAREFEGVPLVANIVEGGRTPQLPAKELGDLGYTIVLYANFLMRVMAHAGQRGLEVLRDTGDSRSLANSMLSWQERQTLVDLDRFKRLECAFDEIATTTNTEETPHE